MNENDTVQFIKGFWREFNRKFEIHKSFFFL